MLVWLLTQPLSCGLSEKCDRLSPTGGQAGQIRSWRRGAAGDGQTLRQRRRPGLIGEHIEIETGKGADALELRPKLCAALAVEDMSVVAPGVHGSHERRFGLV